MSSFSVYILYSKKLNRFYTGSTAKAQKRFEKHLYNRKSTEFTAKANDWEKIFSIACSSSKETFAIERHIKSIKSSKYIKNLISYPEMVEKLQERFNNS